MAEPQSAKTTTEQPPSDLMGWLDFYLVKKAPWQIPSAGREWIVGYGPWIDLIILAISLPALLFFLGIGALAFPFSSLAGVHTTPGFSLVMVFLVAQMLLMIAALPGLFRRQIQGWNLAFYSVAVSLVYNLIGFNILGGVLGAAISTYVLFQIRSYYK